MPIFGKFELKRLAQIAPFASTDAMRHNLNHVRLVGGCAVATDGHRLALQTLDGSADCRAAASDGTVHPALLDPVLLERLAPTSVDMSTEGCVYHTAIGSVSDARVSEHYPDVRQVLPKGEARILQLKDLTAFAKRVRKEKLEKVYLIENFDKSLQFYPIGVYPSGERAEATILNAKYFCEAVKFLNNSEDPVVRVTTVDGFSPVLLECKDRAMVIMPMRE